MTRNVTTPLWIWLIVMGVLVFSSVVHLWAS